MGYLLLGASNLWRIRSRLVAEIRRRDPGAAVAAARGPGRCYVLRAGFWILRYRPLIEVAPPPELRAALLMDVGSDILLGLPPAALADALESAVDRFRARGARVVAVPIFERPLRETGPFAYRLLRSVYYPTSRLTLEALRDGAARVNERLRARAAAGDLALVEGLDSLLGPDRLHFVRWTEAARRLAEALVPAAAPT